MIRQLNVPWKTYPLLNKESLTQFFLDLNKFSSKLSVKFVNRSTTAKLQFSSIKIGDKLSEFWLSLNIIQVLEYICVLIFLNYFLNEKFNLEFEKAEKITTLYLQFFREKPQSSDVSIYDWQLSIWKKALDTSYSHIAEDVLKEYRRLRYRYLKLTSEVRSFLEELHSLYRLGLISNGTSDAQWEKIQECGLESYFDCIVISGETPWKKPDPNIFYKACNELNVKPEQCVIIGDRIETDIEGGKNAHLAATIWIHHTNDDSYQLLPSENNCPDFVVSKVTELKEILCQLNSPAPNETSR